MVTAVALLQDGFGRVRDTAHGILQGLDTEQLGRRIDDRSNPVRWLVWHLARIQDDHVADASGAEQVWTSQGWSQRFDLPFGAGETGYGQSGDQVAQMAQVPVDSARLLGYLDAVVERTAAYLAGLSDADLDRVVDEEWDPPVTLAVRLVSVLSDDLQHLGQAAFVRGLITR